MSNQEFEDIFPYEECIESRLGRSKVEVVHELVSRFYTFSFPSNQNANHEEDEQKDDRFLIDPAHVESLLDFRCACSNKGSPMFFFAFRPFCFQCFYEQNINDFPPDFETNPRFRSYESMVTNEYAQSLFKAVSCPFMILMVCQSDRFTLISCLNPFDVEGFPRVSTVKQKGRSQKAIHKGIKALKIEKENMLMFHNPFFKSFKKYPQIHGVKVNLKKTGKISTCQVRIFNHYHHATLNVFRVFLSMSIKLTLLIHFRRFMNTEDGGCDSPKKMSLFPRVHITPRCPERSPVSALIA